MFVFQEGNVIPIIRFDRNIKVSPVLIEGQLSFSDAIACLASRLHTPKTVFLFWNFFSKCCKNLESFEKRGLERLALGTNAVEFYTDRHETRFLVGIDINGIRRDALSSMVMSMMNDTISFGIGNFRKGNILLVGDTPGNKALGYNTPFVGSGSGLWLLKQLEAADIPEDKYYWINARDNFGVVADQMFLDDLKPKRIIALGVEASKWAMSLRNRYNVVSCPHPQFWLRFRRNQEYPLFKLLK